MLAICTRNSGVDSKSLQVFVIVRPSNKTILDTFSHMTVTCSAVHPTPSGIDGSEFVSLSLDNTICTTHNLISIIVLISLGLIAMSLSLRYSITFSVCLRLQFFMQTIN